MTKHIDLGTSAEWGKKPVQLDVARLLTTKLLVQANSGGGKSWTLRRLLEQLFGAMPHVVIDIDGEFNTLREKFPYVLASAGAGGDCKIDARTAPLLVKRILEHGFSVIVDLSEMKQPARRHFVRVFLEALIEAPRALWRPLLVVVDEAHLFCPEKDQAESGSAVIDLMTRGRKRGFCGVLATQRIAKLNKDAAAECNNKLIGRSALDVDMKRAADELGFTTREQQHQLRALDEGSFFAFGPAISKAVTLIKMGAVQTTHLEPGQGGKTTPPPAPEKLKSILAKLADLPAEAEAEEGELARLRRQVAELQRQGANSGAEDPDGGHSRAVLDQERRVGRREGMEAGFRRAIEAAASMAGRFGSLAAKLVDEVEKFQREVLEEAERRQKILKYEPASAAPAPKPPAPRAAARPVSGDPDLPRPRQAILDALAWLEAAGIAPVRRTTLGLLAEQSPASSGFDNNLGGLRTAGLIDYPEPGTVALTEEGRGRAQHPGGRLTSALMHETLRSMLPSARWRILEALIAAYPASIARADLAEVSGQSAGSSGYDNNLGALRGLGFIDYPKPGHVIARPELFLHH